MLNRLVLETLRNDWLQAASNAAALSFVTMPIILLASLTPGPASQLIPVKPIAFLLNTLFSLLLLFATAFVAAGRYSQIRERTQTLAILKMLGASSGYLFDLLSQESLILTTLGTLTGILFAYLASAVITLILPGAFTFHLAYDWWVLSALFAFAASQLPAFAACWLGLQGDLIHPLSSDA